MTAKLTPDAILRGILRTLVNGWGYSAVQASLETLETGTRADKKLSRSRKAGSERGSAVMLVKELTLPPERTALLQALAIRYDEGSAFPSMTDARAFLLSHQRNAKDIKSRSQAFKRMLPLLAQMSEKGLEKVISRSHHSGPAELDPISRAIRGAGETMRGSVESEPVLPLDEVGRTIAENPTTSAEGHGDGRRQRQAKLKPFGEPGSGDKRSD